MKRLSWDEYFLEIAKTTGLRTSCLKRKVGAVLVDKDNRILSTGYNGPPAGMKHCTTHDTKKCPAVHAEQNALLQALKIHKDISGSTIYVSLQPCATCSKLIIASGIKKVVYSEDYDKTFGLELLKQAGVETKQIGGNNEKQT